MRVSCSGKRHAARGRGVRAPRSPGSFPAAGRFRPQGLRRLNSHGGSRSSLQGHGMGFNPTKAFLLQQGPTPQPAPPSELPPRSARGPPAAWPGPLRCADSGCPVNAGAAPGGWRWGGSLRRKASVSHDPHAPVPIQAAPPGRGGEHVDAQGSQRNGRHECRGSGARATRSGRGRGEGLCH